MNRRRFLIQSAAASALGFPAITRSQSPNSLLQVASIGVGGMGGNTMKSVASHPKVKLVALCDVDAAFLATAKAANKDAETYKDWRELLASAAGKFDAVTIGTPDHLHASIAVTALRAKKHVYLQKPMAPTISECRTITTEAAKAGVVTQLGNQGRSSIESRMTVQMLREGRIGKVKEILIWENKASNWWPKNEALRAQADAVPDGFEWDLWLGVRDPRPFLDKTYHPKMWRAWYDFGVGQLGDMGVHHLDATFDALKLTAPQRVRCTSPGSSGPLWAPSRRVEWEFAGNDLIAGDTLRITWHDGEYFPTDDRILLPKALKERPKAGACWIGEKGTILKPYPTRPFLLPEDKYSVTDYPTQKPLDHYHEWVNAVLEGRKSNGDFTHGGPLTETVLTGTVSERHPGDWLTWDRAAMKFTNCPEAQTQIHRPYRDGWKIEGLG